MKLVERLYRLMPPLASAPRASYINGWGDKEIKDQAEKALAWVAAQTSHISAHELTATVAPFRAWRSLQLIIARGPERATIAKRGRLFMFYGSFASLSTTYIYLRRQSLSRISYPARNFNRGVFLKTHVALPLSRIEQGNVFHLNDHAKLKLVSILEAG